MDRWGVGHATNQLYFEQMPTGPLPYPKHHVMELGRIPYQNVQMHKGLQIDIPADIAT